MLYWAAVDDEFLRICSTIYNFLYQGETNEMCDKQKKQFWIFGKSLMPVKKLHYTVCSYLSIIYLSSGVHYFDPHWMPNIHDLVPYKATHKIRIQIPNDW